MRHTNIKPHGSCLSLVILYLFIASLSYAQQLPPGDDPGSQASRFQEESRDEQRALEKKKVKAPEIDIEKPEKPAAPAEGVKFTLKEVTITGSTLYTDKDFRFAYESYLDKGVTFDDLQNIASNIETVYKRAGYLTAVAYVPEQEITDGKVEIKIMEGKLGEVKIEGNRFNSSKFIGKFIHTKKNEILNVLKLQRDLLRLNQAGDMEVKTVISAGAEPGASDITLKVADKFPYHAGTSVDNQGTRLVGKYRNAFSFRASNLTGGGDTLFFNTVMSATSAGTFASYNVPVDTYGTKVGFDFTVFTNKIGREFKDLGITGITQVYTPHAGGEIYLSDDLQISAEGGLEIKSIMKRVMGEIDSNDQLRQPYIGIDVTKMDSLFGGGQTTASPKFVFGTGDFLGASNRDHTTSSRNGTGGFYFKYEHTLRRTQRMPFESYLSMRSQAQFSTHTLPSSEQFQVGGAYTVRGYPEGDYLADNGATLNLDWFFPFYLIPKDWKLPMADQPLRNQIEPVVFMDLGGGEVIKQNPGERKKKFLMGMGGGVKVHFNRNLFVTVQWAERVGDRPAQSQGPSNFYLTLQCEI